MKKIMFNETYNLTSDAIDGTKPVTRRTVPDKWQTPLTEIFEDCNFDYSEFWKLSDVKFITNEKAPYKVGEVVAIAQSYRDSGYTKEWVVQNVSPNPNAKPTDPFEKKYPGWNNKMFVKAEFMPNFILFTANKIERLQDISDEDCLKEGIFQWGDPFHEDRVEDFGFFGATKHYMTAKSAFAHLINKVSGKGTWDNNPWVFAYTFELVK